ncbi:GH36-type glycosyl hydrolase domain-containing protein [Haploplasma modicum]|uniref:GH36-type glycosyl hydrolase domain-containing protein n=1 Tax=Haploplasma modicum TaxID=2150 RepID=UPI00138AEC51|nr:cellobiose phosphorylase [Haploplasma modicum]
MGEKIKKTINYNQGYYLPLVNLKGLVGSVTPYLSGDLKKGYYNYALEPISELGLFNLSNKRNIIFYVDGERLDLNGQTEKQLNESFEYEVDKLSQVITRNNEKIKMETTSFISINENVEIHLVRIVNTSKKIISLEAVTSVPMYSRSPENIHDHRHVTSLLNIVEVVENGIINKPTLTFDERGHKLNDVIYSVHSFCDKAKVSNYIPIIDEYISGGTMMYPKGLKSSKYNVGSIIKGYECMGAMRFENVNLNPGEEVNYSIIIGVEDEIEKINNNINKYSNFENIKKELKNVKNFYKELNNYINFNVESEKRIDQLKWVTLQPILRRYLGNSYLPHHDYGHGGRGWRDLWQDLLSLIYSADKSVSESIYENFAGVRIDGSNATIIGEKVGEFKSDRNQIVRVWSDHGAWPLLTTKLYIDETGDLDILFKKQKYFEDGFTHYSKMKKPTSSDNNILMLNGKVYEGTILEHLLLQNLIGYFNIGEHGFTRLEDADWNDGLDMANKKGETIPFTMFYLENLRVLADILSKIDQSNIEIFESLSKLVNEEFNIFDYFNEVSSNKGLNKVNIDKNILSNKLKSLASKREETILQKAIINNQYYQSYVDNDGNFLDSEKTMSLTAQTMALMNNIPSKDFAIKVAEATRDKLFDNKIGGYRLNSDYKKILTNMGRAYGFAYGHKENGAVFCHMATMYTYGLYNYDLVNYGNEAVMTLLNQALKEESQVLAGVPEYYNNQGKGKYMFLTGTASWLIKLYREQIFGINMNYGELLFNPKLVKNDFINGVAEIETYIKNKKIKIKYINQKELDFGKYQISKIVIGNKETNDRVFKEIGENVEVYLDEFN